MKHALYSIHCTASTVIQSTILQHKVKAGQNDCQQENKGPKSIKVFITIIQGCDTYIVYNVYCTIKRCYIYY